MKLLRVAVAVSGAEVERAITSFELCGVFNSAVEWEVGEPVEEPAWGQPAPLPERADVAAYLPDESWARISTDFAAVLAELWPAGAAPPIAVREIPQRDWRTAWHEHFDLVRVPASRTIVIRPPHIAYAAAAGEVVIDLSPGLAFGTGQHQSTRLSLSLLADAIDADSPPTVLDLGTGSGILACAAAKLGARSVLGVDIDPLAVDAARETARRNQVGDAVEIREGSGPGDGRYGLILANLTADLLQGLASEIAGAADLGGQLIASGFIDARREEVAAALATAGFEIVETRTEDEWAALLGRMRRR